jgi:hypothetical protein
VANLIPRQHRPDLSPLLVAAGEWPVVSRLTRPSDERRAAPVAEKEKLRPAPSRARQLLEAARDLLHPALLDEADEDRLHWTPAPERDLYLRLRHVPRPDPTLDPHAAWSAWSGWASWAPSKDVRPAFCVHAWVAKRLGPADASLSPMLEQVLKPALADELLRGPRTTRAPSPAVHGPDHHAALFILSEAGFGVAYPYVYAYTDGERLVLAVQPLAHAPLKPPPATGA